MQKFLTALFMAAVLAACGDRSADEPAVPATTTEQAGAPQSAENKAETARLNEWVAARREEELDFSPIRKTILGHKDDYDKVDDLSERSDDEAVEYFRANSSSAEGAILNVLIARLAPRV